MKATITVKRAAVVTLTLTEAEAILLRSLCQWNVSVAKVLVARSKGSLDQDTIENLLGEIHDAIREVVK